jgi:hypothetical protein
LFESTVVFFPQNSFVFKLCSRCCKGPLLSPPPPPPQLLLKLKELNIPYGCLFCSGIVASGLID